MNFLTAIFIAVGVLAGMAVSTVYVTLIHDPQVIATARAGYVLEAEKSAAEAAAAEMTRQRNAASQALSEAQKRQAADEAAQQAQQAQTDQDIADYENRLEAANRTCAVDADDLRFLQSH